METISKLNEILRKYKAGKANLERRIIENEQFWKLRHWNYIKSGGENDPRPTSAWLTNCILSKHADAMDSYPEPNCLPREPGDKSTAHMLSQVLPVIIQQNDFQQVWSDVWWYKLKSGTGVYKVMWDSAKLRGLGDISIKKADILNLFWEPGITDIQQSPYFFHVELTDTDVLAEKYPAVKTKKGAAVTLSKYIYDDTVDTTGKSLVVDVYYKVRRGADTVLHYVKYTGDTVLYSSEEMGLPCFYSHGKYPYVFDVLFPEEGTPCGFGYIDLCKEPQKYIDMLNNAIMKNALTNAAPRWFIRADGSVNEEEYADFSKTFVHTNGNLGADSIREITSSPLNDIYVSVMQLKIQEMKETAGNRDVNNGGTASGVTAASAIAAMQEQAGKLSRDMLTSGYRAFRNISILCIELIRQFYDMPRHFRILGKDGGMEFISFDNSALMPRSDIFGAIPYSPVFDIEVSAQKESAYSKLAYNELALQLFKLGFFTPANAQQAVSCLSLMDFKGKNELVSKLNEGATLENELLKYKKLCAAFASRIDPALSEKLAGGEKGGITNKSPGGSVSLSQTDSFGALKNKEPKRVLKARADAQSAAQPR